MANDIITKLKNANLVGRGGACFPTGKKWEIVKNAAGEKKYVICNASEGEPGIKKDAYILEHHADRLVDGIRIAVEFLGAEKAYIYINPDYFKLYRAKLEKLIGKGRLEVYEKKHEAGYVGGEETSAINSIEGRRIEPRLKPPFPTVKGLWGMPTLVNNVETFYDVSLIAAGEYEYKRFYTVGGDCLNDGVYAFHKNWTIAKILEATDNYPDFEFFVQAGGDASGIVLNSDQLGVPVIGSGAITVYSMLKAKPLDLMKRWIDFFKSQSCGQCTPCREGTLRLKEIIYSEEPDWKLAGELLDNLRDTSFCGLGCAVPNPFFSFAQNVLPLYKGHNIDLPVNARKLICDCFH